MTWEDIVRIIQRIWNSLPGFINQIHDTLTWEIRLLIQGELYTYSLFDILFGIGISGFIIFNLIKWGIDAIFPG